MRKLIYILLLLATLMPQQAKAVHKYDINGDGTLNTDDAIALLARIVKDPTYAKQYDFYADGRLSVCDVTTLAKEIKNTPQGGIDVGIGGWDDSGEDYGGTVSAPRRSYTEDEDDTVKVTIPISYVGYNGFQMSMSVTDGYEFVNAGNGYAEYFGNTGGKDGIIMTSEPANNRMTVAGFRTSGDIYGYDNDLILVSIRRSDGNKIGRFIITFSDVELSNVENKPVPFSIDEVAVGKETQHIVWEQDFENVYEGDVLTLTATATSGLDVYYDIVVGWDKSSINGNELSISAPGEIHIMAKQDGNEIYEEAVPVTKVLNANSGIEGITADGIKLRIEGSDLIVDGGRDITVFTIDGSLVFQGRNSRITLQKSKVYLLRHADSTIKFAIK